MNEQLAIHFIEAPSFQECEKKVNEWIGEQEPFSCTILHVNVMPMLVGNKLIFLTVLTYSGKTANVQNNTLGG